MLHVPCRSPEAQVSRQRERCHDKPQAGSQNFSLNVTHATCHFHPPFTGKSNKPPGCPEFRPPWTRLSPECSETFLQARHLHFIPLSPTCPAKEVITFLKHGESTCPLTRHDQDPNPPWVPRLRALMSALSCLWPLCLESHRGHLAPVCPDPLLENCKQVLY